MDIIERLQKLQNLQAELRARNKGLIKLLPEAQSDPNNRLLVVNAIIETRRVMMANRLGPGGLRALNNELRQIAAEQPQVVREYKKMGFRFGKVVDRCWKPEDRNLI